MDARASFSLSCVLLASGCNTREPAASSPTVEAPAASSAPAAVEEIRASVTAELEGHRTIESGRDAWRAESSYVVVIRPAGEGLSCSIEGFSGWRGELPRTFADGAGFVQPYLSPITLTPQGDFLRLEDPPRARAAITEQLPALRNPNLATTATMRHALSDAGLDAIARDLWATEREMWRALALEPRTERRIDSRMAVPQLGGGELDLVVIARRGEDAPCPGASERACANFTMMSSPDPEQVAAIVGRTLGTEKIAEFAMTTNLTLSAEIDTFLPYAYVVERRVATHIEGQQPVGETSRRAYAYVYDRR